MSSIAARKGHHLELCATADVGFRGATTLLEQVRFLHDALPDLALEDLDLSATFLGKRLRAPLLVAAMTGGTEEARQVNRELAQIAEARGYAFGLGSQRAMHVNREAADSYRVRDVAPTVPLLGNLGVVQAKALSTADIASLAAQVGADGLCIHLNVAQELAQAGGDRDFRGGLTTVARLVAELGLPIMVKETGCGLSAGVGARLRTVGVRHVDVSGAGGTSWVGVEALRAPTEGARRFGERLWDWGIPTAASVGLLAPLGFDTLVATGGVATGSDVARAVALGATCAGIARPVLKALKAGGRDGVHAFFDEVETELRAVMILTGSRTLADLRRVPRILGPELTAYLQTGAFVATQGR